jgi:hypothetical protein
VLENRLLRRMFGPKRDEVVGGWRKVPSEERRNLYYLAFIITMIRSNLSRAGDVARMG